MVRISAGWGSLLAMNDDRTAPIPGPRTHGLTSGHLSGHVPGQLPVRMHGPSDMAEMLPFLLGFFPDDSIVAVGLQGPGLQQGGVIRVDIPEDASQWPQTAEETARLLVDLSEERDCRPDQVLLYLCRDDALPEQPRPRRTGPRPELVEALSPLARWLARAFEGTGVVVKESLCISGGRWWSYLCTGPTCCDPAGRPIRSSHVPSALAAAATFAGLAPRGSRKAIMAALAPISSPDADVQRAALDGVGPMYLRELSRPGGRLQSVERTAELLAEAVAEFRAGAKKIGADRAARLLVGLQDKLGRDRAAEFAEPDELVAAQRLWRFLARRCVPPFDHLAVPPLTLLAWTAWLADDVAMARIVLSRALDIDPRYTLAQLLHESINGGLAPGQLLHVIRAERAARPDGPSAPSIPRPRLPEWRPATEPQTVPSLPEPAGVGSEAPVPKPPLPGADAGAGVGAAADAERVVDSPVDSAADLAAGPGGRPPSSDAASAAVSDGAPQVAAGAETTDLPCPSTSEVTEPPPAPDGPDRRDPAVPADTGTGPASGPPDSPTPAAGKAGRRTLGMRLHRSGARRADRRNPNRRVNG